MAELADASEEAREFGRDVHVQYGKLRIVAPWFVIALALGGGGSWYAVDRLRPADSASQSAAYAEVMHKFDEAETRASARAQAQEVVNGRLLDRTAGLETAVGELRATNAALLAAIARTR